MFTLLFFHTMKTNMQIYINMQINYSFKGPVGFSRTVIFRQAEQTINAQYNTKLFLKWTYYEVLGSK